MIIDAAKLPNISSISTSCGRADIELEEPVPDLASKKGQRIIFLATGPGGEDLFIITGIVLDYEKVTSDRTDKPWARLMMTDAINVSISPMHQILK